MFDAAKRIPSIQEQFILSVYRTHIEPKLDDQHKQALTPKIEKGAKAAGIALTALEATLIVGGIVKILSLRKSQNDAPPLPTPPHASVSPPDTPIPPPTSRPTPATREFTPAQEILHVISKPAERIVTTLRESKETASILAAREQFLPETIPTALNAPIAITTKVFTPYDASDFLSTMPGAQISMMRSATNTSYDHGFAGITGETVNGAFTAINPDTNPPPVTFSFDGRFTGYGVRFSEGKFAQTPRINRPFWSVHFRDLSPAKITNALEAGFSALTPAFTSPMHLAGASETLTDRMQEYFAACQFPFPVTVHTCEGSGDVHAMGREILAALPTEAIHFYGNRSWWDLDPQFRKQSNPILAGLLDELATRASRSGSSPYLFVLSPEQGNGKQSQEAFHNALLMQTAYSLFFPLVRNLRGMSSSEPFRVALPTFATSPAVERAVRFFTPTELPFIARYSAPHTIITGESLSKRGTAILALLNDIHASSWPNALTHFKKESQFHIGL